MTRRAILLLTTALTLLACDGGPQPSGSPTRAAPSAPDGVSVATVPPTIAPAPTVPPSIAPAVACPPGSTPDEPGPIGQARPPGHTGPMIFDRNSHRIVLLAGLHRDAPARARLWSFDVCTNTWSRMDPGVPLSNMNDDPALVYDPGSDRILLIGPGSVWAYDAVSGSWSRSDAPTTVSGGPPQAVFDPISGRFIVRAADMWSYAAGADSWREIEQRGEIPGLHESSDCWARFLTYDASVDRLVLYLGYCAPGGAWNPEGWTWGTWEFDPRARTWSKQSISTPVLGSAFLPRVGDSYAYDEAHDRMVVHSSDGLIAYDATAHRWSTVSDSTSEPRPLDGSVGVVYDPVNARVVLYRDGVWAFDLATRTWTRLLAPSET